MQVKDTAASLVLGLLFASVVAIFLVTDQNPLVVGLSVILIAICLIIVELGGWREVGIIGMIAAVVSVIGVYMVGRERFGGLGAVLLPIVWAMLVFTVFTWITRNLQAVPSDRAILVRRTYTDAPVNLSEPLAPPLIPFFEQAIAIIPLYKLSTDTDVKEVNTQKGNVSSITVHAEYKIADREKAGRAMSQIPNRGLIQSKLARLLNKSVDEARTDVLFWEQLLESQMQAEVDDVVRNVVFTHFSGPRDVYLDRTSVVKEIQAALQERVETWGVSILNLFIDTVNIPQDKLSGKTKAELAEDQNNLDAARLLKLTNTEAVGDAERVRQLMNALREARVEITPVMVENIIASLASDPDEQLLELEIQQLLKSGSAPSKK